MEAASPEKPNRFLPIMLFLVAVGLRLPFTSKFLYHHDSVNFALALDNFDLRLHQPHPPGYLLYVMLGRVLNLFIPDCNAVLIAISVVFTSLTVVLVHYLGTELYDRRTGIIAAVLATASPNLWFHGEIALSYGVEAFFSAAIAYLCWQLHKGRGDLLYLSALLLALAGGFRQNTCLFLLPLWLISARRLPTSKLIAALALLAALCGGWLALTVAMTGGIDAYAAAFGDLWTSNTGHNSVFEKGWGNAWLFGKTLMTFSLYSLGAGVVAVILAVYRVARSGDWGSLCRGKAWFYLGWMLPSYLFYQLIFIHPANPGYFLILLPPLVLLSARSVIGIADVVERRRRKFSLMLMTAAIVLANIAIFFASDLPVSQNILARHDRDLAAILRALRRVDPSTTAIVLRPSIFYGFRMVMYYLPQYRVYNADPSGVTFSGNQRRTILSDSLTLPATLRKAATIRFGATSGSRPERQSIPGLSSAWLVSGPSAEIVQQVTTSLGTTRSPAYLTPEK